MTEKDDVELHHHINGDAAEKCVEDNSISIVDGENVCLQSPSSECSVKSFVVKVPRANSKLILQNMEEVLNSVKKKHRQKHRRKREQKKLAMLAEAELAEADHDDKVIGIKRDSVSSVSSSTSREKNHSTTERDNGSSKKSMKKPLQEQQAIQDQCEQPIRNGKGKSSHNSKRRNGAGISPTISAVPAETGMPSAPNNTEKECSEDALQKPKSTTNAFEVMMNARNRSIGSNTPGKETSMDDIPPCTSNVEKSKRKLMLQSWAERKGGLKRKMEEEMRSAYVEERLERRAKRLKKMLTTSRSPDTSNSREKAPSNSKKDQSSVSCCNNEPKRRRTSSRRSRRLSSCDSVESPYVEKPQPLDNETVEFLSKLSSPTKKRDSLLGYFKKIPSPNEGSGKKSSSVIETPKAAKTDTNTPPKSRRPKPKSTKRKLLDLEEVANATPIEIECDTPNAVAPPTSVRPRRSCVDKAKYDYDLEVDNSPKKERAAVFTNETSRRRNKSRKRHDSPQPMDVHDDSHEADIIELDSSSSFAVVSNDDKKTPKKLAPLFVRAMPVPKPSPDPEALKARQEFLRSGVPEKLKLEQEKQKQFDLTYEEGIELFPKISHMPQWTQDDVKFLAKIFSKCKTFQLKNAEETFDECEMVVASSRLIGGGGGGGGHRKGKTTTKGSRNSLIGLTNCVLRDFRLDKKSIKSGGGGGMNPPNHLFSESLPIVTNKRQIIKSWKSEFDRFPTYKCYNQLRTKYRFFSVLDSAQDTEQVTESFVVTRSTRRPREASSMSIASQEDDVKPPDTAPNGELLFTEKYKPMLFDQVLVNLTPVAQLRDFLASWANGGGCNGGRNSNIDDSMDYINESSSSQQPSCNSVVLLGPASSGKTNAVFTLANEMNFNVLEINAGMKRTGKKITQELLEATQSHQIRNESSSGSGSSVKSKAQKNLLKISLDSLKGRKQIGGGGGGGGNNGSGASEVVELPTETTGAINVRKSLILIEDADITFEQTDAGFTDAVYALAASSKRPVIIVASNPNCQHLQRLMAQNTINFTAPNALNISKYLAVLSLMENCPVSLDDLISLYLYNQHDLRKTLHELQFFIQSGGDRKRLELGNFGNSNSNLSEQCIQQQQQKTPQKQSEKGEAVGQYFASPGKRRFSSEDNSSPSRAIAVVNDEHLKRETTYQREQHDRRLNQNQSIEEQLYVHRTLFEFYTVDQNSKWRIPFPVNFDLFHINLSDIFAVSKKLQLKQQQQENKTTNSKRKSRSPKKVWLSTATATATATTTANNEAISEKGKNSAVDIESLNALSCFYNNVSIANSVVTRDASRLSCASKEPQHVRDRLMPYLSESISHDILEHAINVNLEAELCPYNLFDSQKKSTKLCDLMGPSMVMLPKRVRSVDFEPALRAICRSEQQRAAQERRSTRFYHYLRSSSLDMCNFSQRPFENVCTIFQEQEEPKQITRP